MTEVAQSGFSTKVWQPDGSEPPILFERYQILGIIGEGGMGTVFKAYHLNLKRHVAIKTLRFDHRKSPEMVNRFLKEMELIGQMDHGNVVRATDAGERNGVFYLVMEYLPGSDLARVAARKGRLEVSQACEWIRQAALGLDYIHQTLIHRDIKPSNLQLTTAGVVKILDLGLARFSFDEPNNRENTPVGFAVGTYAYMAPEQAAAAPIDGRADLYSLGCTLFKLVTGHAPYSGSEYDNAAKVLYAHCHVPLTSLPSFTAVPTPLRSVLLKMMAKEPENRYRSGKEVAEAMTPFIATDASGTPNTSSGSSDVADETPVKPLPWPLPAELSRLTEAPEETPRDNPSATSSIDLAQVRRRRLPPRVLVGIGIAAVCLAILIGFVVLVPWRDLQGNRIDSGPRRLDDLALHTSHRLLDEAVRPIGFSTDQPQYWRWDQKALTLDVKGPRTLFFPLGTTSRLGFTLEAGLTQTPWTGNAGIFWGYREDADIKSAKEPHRDFAWFQLLLLGHRRNDKEGDVDSVRRGRGTLHYDLAGELRLNLHFTSKHDVGQLIGTEKTLVVTISNNRLQKARLAGTPLTGIGGFANDAHQNDPYDGPLGLIAAGHNVVFSEVRFSTP